MLTAKESTGLKADTRVSYWHVLATLEAVVAALFTARLAFGPVSQASHPALWLAGSAVWLAAYLPVNLWITGTLVSASKLAPVSSSHARPPIGTVVEAYGHVVRSGASPHDSRAFATAQDDTYHGVCDEEPWDNRSSRWLLRFATLPFLAVFTLGLFVFQFKPGAANGVWTILSTIEPFPTAVGALGLLLVFLAKLLAASTALPDGHSRRVLSARLSEAVAIPAALLLLGLLQSSVYVTPIGNAFLRYWAIADAASAGVSYPVTLTESAPIAAGSPPYVYDLPLFPLMLRLSLTILGHTSTAAHLPAAFFSLLFPLSLYLLIRRATGSGPTAVIFAVLASLFPYLRFWVLNLPDPDALLLTSACLTGYFYLRALDEPDRSLDWILAGLFAGVLALARPEGILYSGFFTLGLLASGPRKRQFLLFALCLGLFVAPMVYTWMANFGFLWPQNYNRTLRLDYPFRTYDVLQGSGALARYANGLGLTEAPALGLLVLFVASTLLGSLLALFRDRRLLALAIPGIGNSVVIFFTNPFISNAYHFSDFFRHASFGIPFLVVMSAYGLLHVYRYLVAQPRLRLVAHVCVFLLLLAIVREGDILANPTATHRPASSWPPPTQALVTYVHLSMEDILRHPLPLPPMSYYRKDEVTVAYPTLIRWPDDGMDFFRPMDMTFQRAGSPFGYAAVAAFLIALSYALLARRDRA